MIDDSIGTHQYYLNSGILSVVYFPPTLMGVAIYTWLFGGAAETAAAMAGFSVILYIFSIKQYDFSRPVYGLVGNLGYVKFRVLLAAIGFGAVIFLAFYTSEDSVSETGARILQDEETVALLLLTILACTVWLVFHYWAWPRMGQLYGRHDRDVFAEEYAELSRPYAQARNTRAHKPGQSRKRVKPQKSRDPDLRFVGHLKRYKCGVFLPKFAGMLNIMVFAIAIERDDPKSPLYEFGAIDGFVLFVIVVAVQAAWRVILVDDARLQYATRVVGAAPRVFVDLEWLGFLYLLPGIFITIAALYPDTTIPLWQTMLYGLMVVAESILFFALWYPGSPPKPAPSRRHL